MDFVSTIEGKEGPAVWLAKRGVTFVALTRVGRWNFLAPTKDGSWETRADRTADADVQPHAESALAAERLRGEALRRVRRSLRQRERDLPFPAEGHCAGKADARGDAARVCRGIPPCAGEGAFPIGEARSFSSGACRPEARACIRLPSTTRPTAISAGAPARPGLRMSTTARSVAISTTSMNTARCGFASAASTISSSTPGTSIPTRGRNGGRPR